MEEGADEGIVAVEEALRRSDAPQSEVLALLGAGDWRPHLPAAVAVCLGQSAPVVEEALWAAFDRSWVAPQLAVAAALTDPGFAAKARAYIMGVALPAEGIGLGAVGKRLAALAYLCRLRGDEPWLADVLQKPEMQRALAQDALEDRGAAVAERWLAGLRRYAASRAREG